jgi:large subunit ribosomal protein L25
MSNFIVLEAEKRELLGKKVKALRRMGKVPAVIYGPESDTINLAIDKSTLRQVLAEAGGTQLIEMQVGEEKIPTLAREVQRDIIHGDILHVDFYRVSMTRTISADVPVVLINESPVVASGEGILVQGLNSLLIEALPADLPSQVEVDMQKLEEIGDQLLVSDLDLPGEVTILTDEGELVVKADYPTMLEEEDEDEEELDELFLEEMPEVEVITERRSDEEEFEDEE